MARWGRRRVRRTRRVSVPFFRLKINKKTIFNIIGFFLIGAAVLFLISLFGVLSQGTQGVYLERINASLREKFGIFSYLLPFVMLLLSGHFFNVKRLKFVKINISLGGLLIFVSLLGVFRAGSWGSFCYTNLAQDFSPAGAITILVVAFLVGLILFLDTSVDAFVLFLIDAGRTIWELLKNHGFREMLSKDKNQKGKVQDSYIHDKNFQINKKPLETSRVVATPTPVTQSQDMSIKPLLKTGAPWQYPPLTLLTDVSQTEADRGDIKRNADTIEKTLDSFGIRARVAEVNFGPTVTQYALEITMGTKLSKISALSNDFALALAAPTGQVRIEAPIPGRAMVGIELPNKRPEIVTLKRLLSTPHVSQNHDPILVPLGLDVSGAVQMASISKMPHVLIAGTTGSGKSVLLNAWIATFLFRTKPEDLRLIMVDPKRVELTLYNGIPHLLTEVIVEPEKIIKALRWTVGEMEARYKEFATKGVRNLEGYNNISGIEKKPYIIFVIDELADIMIFAPGDAEDLITRIAQMARATGIHLLLATQRPSVDVITGLMKANIPTRIAFNVSTMVDSRVIIDMPGAEKLLGRGDMLYLPPDQAKPRRIQGPYVTEHEIHEVVGFLKAQAPQVNYTQEITEKDAPLSIPLRSGGNMSGVEGQDPLFKQSIELIASHDKASASLLQRRLSIGYARAARILDQLEAAGIVGPAEGSKPREVLRRGMPEEPENTGAI